MACPNFDKFLEAILEFDQKVIIDQDKDKPLRYNVWETLQSEVAAVTDKLSTKVLPDEKQSLRIAEKIQNAIKRIKANPKDGGSIQEDIFNDDNNIALSIALQEVMESVKGEADKARNMGQDPSTVSKSGVLPALPLSRVAASIGRKIAFQKGYRFKRGTDEESAALIESFYYAIGKEAIADLERKGYATIDDDIPTLMDYQNKKDLKKDFPKNDTTRTDVRSVSLVEKKLGISANSPESAYFLNRTEADLEDSDLGVVTEKLRVANMLVQPVTVVIPDESNKKTKEEIEQWDDGVETLDPVTSRTRRRLYEKPLQINTAMDGLLTLLHAEHQENGHKASTSIRKIFGNKVKMIRSLFGLKRSDDFSIDKKESVGGQNLSKTTPLDDIVEYYDLLKGNLHMPMKVGRNARLYYLNSVVNAHGSKHSRYMLTPGEYTLDVSSDDYNTLVFHLSESLKTKDSKGVTEQFTFAEITDTGSDRMTKAMTAFDNFNDGDTLRKKSQALGQLAHIFPGVDYVTMVTALQGIRDVQGKKGQVKTEFPIAADATASGGSLTFMQAIGTNPKVVNLLQRIGILQGDSLVQKDLDDIYGLMTESVASFLKGEPGSGFGGDLGETDVKGLLQDTVDMLFIKDSVNPNKEMREFSKDPTMTFIYGQGQKAGEETLARSLADNIIDNLDDPFVKQYLTQLMGKKVAGKGGVELRETKDLYPEIVQTLKDSGLPASLYTMMEDNIKHEFLDKYTDRSQQVYNIAKEVPSDTPMKILPAGAVMAGIKPTKENLEKYGMPITKIVEVLNELEDGDSVLTRREKLTKTVMDVSTTHGQDAALLYHAIDRAKPKNGVVVIHDEIRGSVADVKAVEKAYAELTVEMIGQYDVHQQVMEAIAAYNPELASSVEFKALKASIDQTVAEKKAIISAQFDENTDSLIGDGVSAQTFSGQSAVDTAVEDTVQSTIPSGEPLPSQDFGDLAVTIKTDEGTADNVNAQSYWDELTARLDMVKDLRVCLNG